ncbi:MAG: monovalent cation/H(+) antiporter subunit G [Phycisphaeraceae bacterium]|nr:monovalent cation/H(+) antiporter subunit G [Phycisphaerae bacterium]MBX3391417.1 monovalent cation/H(+) antiporter subunit G [Phycisphaeraceae bacterium]
MTQTIAVFSAAAIILGTLFSIVGVVGFLRFPDIYSRLHATGKVSVFGVTILLLAAVVLDVAGIGKALVLITFLILSGPALSHAISAAAWRSKVPMVGHDEPVRGPDEQGEP